MVASLLSISRFFLAIWAFYEIVNQQRYFLSAVIFSLGALSDFLDGWVARRFGQKTRIGAELDHLSDKFLVLSGLFALYLVGRVEFLPFILLAIRELFIAFLRFNNLVGGVNFLGKLKTSFEFAALIALCLLPFVGIFLLWVAVFIAYLSALVYITKPLRVGVR